MNAQHFWLHAMAFVTKKNKYVFFMAILNLLEEKVYENVTLYVNFSMSIPGECR